MLFQDAIPLSVIFDNSVWLIDKTPHSHWKVLDQKLSTLIILKRQKL